MKILLIQLRRIGDVLLTAPVASILKERFPQATIHFLVEKPGDEVLFHHPHIDRVILYDKTRPFEMIRQIRREKYDWVFDFLNNPRSALLTALSGARQTVGFPATGWKVVYQHLIKRPSTQLYIVDQKKALLSPLTGVIQKPAPKPHIYFSSEEKEAMKKTWESLGFPDPNNVIGIVPTHRRDVRRWTPQGFAEVVDRLSDQYQSSILFFRGPGEEGMVEEVTRRLQRKWWLAPLGTLRDLCGLLSHCRLTIGSDSGPLHMAIASGSPTVAIYGPTNPISINPHNDPLHLTARHPSLSCLGCELVTCPFGHECMKDLSSEVVLEASRRILGPGVC